MTNSGKSKETLVHNSKSKETGNRKGNGEKVTEHTWFLFCKPSGIRFKKLLYCFVKSYMNNGIWMLHWPYCPGKDPKLSCIAREDQKLSFLLAYHI